MSYPNNETENAVLSLQNDQHCVLTLRDAYTCGYLNIYRIKKEIKLMADRDHLHFNMKEIDWSVVFTEMYNYFADDFNDRQLRWVADEDDLRGLPYSTLEHNEEQTMPCQMRDDDTEIKIPEMEQRTYYGRHNLADCTDDQIYNFVRDINRRINNLTDVRDISKSATVEIERLVAKARELGKYVDDRNNIKD